MNWSRVRTVARTELKQLIGAKDFWVPMTILGGFFFAVVPFILLIAISSIGNVSAIQQVSDALKLLPQTAQNAVPQNVGPSTQVSYVLAVYLFAPIAVVVPLTISTAVGASSIVGEMFPAATALRPARSTSNAVSAVVVVLPFVPVLASSFGA